MASLVCAEGDGVFKIRSLVVTTANMNIFAYHIIAQPSSYGSLIVLIAYASAGRGKWHLFETNSETNAWFKRH